MKKKKELNVAIGTHIQTAREAAGLTQEQLAELLPMATTNLSSVECGTVGISLKTLVRICEILSVSSDTILFGETEKNDAGQLAARLERLPPAQFRIAENMLNALFAAFASAEL